MPIRPHLPAVAVAPPWCAHCGPGELVETAGQRRPVRRHAADCPDGDYTEVLDAKGVSHMIYNPLEATA